VGSGRQVTEPTEHPALADQTDPTPPGSARTGEARVEPGFWPAVGRFVVRRPGTVATVATVVALAAAALSAAYLRIRPGYVDLLSRDAPAQARYLDLLDELGNVEAMYIVVEAADPAVAARFVDAFGPALSDLKDGRGRPAATDVLWRVDQRWFLERVPAHLPDAVLAEAAGLDGPAAGRLGDALRDPTASRILGEIEQGLEAASSTPGAEGDEAKAATFLGRGIASLLDELARAASGAPASCGAWLLGLDTPHAGADVDAAGHLLAGPGRYLLTLTPADTSNNYEVLSELVAGVRAAAARVQADQRADVRVRLTGAPVLVVNEMRAVMRDMTVATLLALALESALFLVSFASVRHVLLAVLALLAGIAISFGAALALVGYLNLFSAVFAAVLVGQGLDFGIHFVNQHELGLRRGLAPRAAILDAYRHVGAANTVAAGTTAAAFLATVVSEFRGFSQLGLISAAGILACLLTAFTLLPALLALTADRDLRVQASRLARPPWTHGLLDLPKKHSGAVVLVGVVLIAATALTLPTFEFDYNLLNLQPAGTEAAALAVGSDGRRVATHLAYSTAGTLPAAAALEARLEALPSVASARSAASVLPPQSPERLAHLARLAALLPVRVQAAPPVDPEGEPARATAALERLESRLLAVQDLAFEGGRTEVVTAIDEAVARVPALRDALAVPGAAAGLAAFRETSRVELAGMVSLLPVLARGEGLSVADLPPALAARFVGRTGTLPVIIEPREGVWERPALERLVAELRTVDPDVTGPPVQILELTTIMRRSCQQAAVLSFLVIAVLVALGLREWRGTLVALSPLVAGFVIMIGVAAWLGVRLNPANLIALPILLAIGVDAGVHVTHAWLHPRERTNAVTEVGHGILVSTMTTIAGLGSLLVAQHRGVRSLGQLSTIGLCAMLFTALVLLPAVLHRWGRTRAPETPDTENEP
jgi:hypothetical protein